jgi:curli biogenesis system outer membrane secretion channel CsgG
MKNTHYLIILLMTFLVAGCVTTTPSVEKVNKPTIVQPQIQPVKIAPVLKRKVAIARFGNEAQYSKSSLFGVNTNYNAEKQATDILSAKLTQSGKFILLERNDINLINKENERYNLASLNIGADYLIVGSVSEFGRKKMSDTGVFSRTKKQTAYAKVSVRLIKVTSGEIVFAQEGSGEASSEAGSSFGLGKHVGYDSTLNDKAISTAISSVVDGIMQNLLNTPWRSYVLSIDKNGILIAGGEKQGLQINDIFSIFIKGKKIKNPQTGMLIELPGNKIANIRVISQFGSSYTDEGSICQLVDGTLNGVNIEELYVQK